MAVTRDDAIAWRRSFHEAICDAIEPWEHGRVVRAGHAPTYWDYNTLVVEGPSGLDVETLVAEADRLLGDLAHRKVDVEDEATGDRLRPKLQALRWWDTKLVWMVTESPPSAALPDRLEEAGAEATHDLRLQWTENFTREEVAAHMPTEDRINAMLGVRAFVLRGDDGAPIAFTNLRVEGDEAEIMQVFVTPSRRGGGLGAALTSATAAAAFDAGVGRVWITADAEGRPRHLYGRLGFRPVWTAYEFTRRPPA